MILKIMVIMFFLSLNVYAENGSDIKQEAVSIARSIGKIDMKCWQLQQHGPCVVGDVPGVRISYYEPTLVITTKTAKASLNALSGGNLQFHDAHIYDFPLKQVEKMVLCPAILSNTAGIRYLSELDKPKWRTETMQRAFDFIGNWGPLYPRTGFINHYSPAVSSALVVLRAISAAGVASGHVSIAPILFPVNQAWDKMQMLEPYQMRCMPLGQDVRLWQNNQLIRFEPVDREGNYMWVYWRYTQCCKTAIPDPTSL